MRIRAIGVLTIVVFGIIAAAADEIKVAAAADLSYALQDLAARFEQKTGNHVALSFGSSGNLYSQIRAGAPFDMFFSADMDYPKKLAEDGVLDDASVRPYAQGHLVLWVPKSLGLDPQKLRMDLLAKAEVKKIAIANPEHAPYGRAAMQVLEHSGLKAILAPKLVYGENVSQAAQFVRSGNAQAGLIALSLAMSPAMKESGLWWDVPKDAYAPLRQGLGIVSNSKHKATARAFVDFVTSPEGQGTLKKYGFEAPQ